MRGPFAETHPARDATGIQQRSRASSAGLVLKTFPPRSSRPCASSRKSLFLFNSFLLPFAPARLPSPPQPGPVLCSQKSAARMEVYWEALAFVLIKKKKKRGPCSRRLSLPSPSERLPIGGALIMASKCREDVG